MSDAERLSTGSPDSVIFPDGSESVSVTTPAIENALSFVREYAAPEQSTDILAGSGNIVTVVGAPGTGKTHLLSRLAAECTVLGTAPDDPHRPVRCVRVDGSAADIDELGRQFTARLPRDEVVACVREYHTDLVVGLIADPDLAERAGSLLRDPDLSPRERDDYVVGLGLSRTELLEQLHRRLRDVVRDEVYAAAFAMLLRTGLTDAAWQWLRGAPPAPVLQERGIPEPAPAGPRGMVPFGHLYTGQGFRLVVAVDDVDQLVTGQERERALRTLQQALLQLREAGVLVFLSYRPESRGRSETDWSMGGPRLALTGFGRADVEQYVRAGSRNRILAPFDRGALERLMDVTSGNPALLAELVTRLRHEAARQDRPVKEETVLRESRQYFSVVDKNRVASAIRRVLDHHARRFHQRYALTVDPIIRLDFWLPIPVEGHQRSGCAIIIADAVVDDGDVETLSGLVTSLRRVARAEALVVMSGAVSAPHAAQLNRLFDREPLAFTTETFDDDLDAAVKSMVYALEDEAGTTSLAHLADRIGRLDEQQVSTQSLLLEMSDVLTDVRRGMSALRSSTAPADAEPSPVGGRAGAADRGCARVLDGLAELGTPVARAKGMFLRDHTGTAAARQMQRLLDRDGSAESAWGALVIVTAVVGEFRTEVRSWFRTMMPSPEVVPGAAELSDLNGLCLLFSTAVEWLPLDRLDGLGELSPDAPRSVWQERFALVIEALRGLPDYVRAAAAGDHSRP